MKNHISTLFSKILLVFFTLISFFSVAQTSKKISEKTIDDKVDAIYLARLKQESILIKLVQPFMNSDMETNYKVVLYNGKKKKIIAIEISLDFNALPNQSNPDQIITQQFKTSFYPKTVKSFIFKNVALTGFRNPDAGIARVVYSDGSFDEPMTGLSSFYGEMLEKEKIKKELLQKMKE